MTDVTKQIPEATESIQARARVDEPQAGLFFLMAATGGLVSPWWSQRRDMDLREFYRGVDHFVGALYTIASKVAAVPFRVEPRDPAVKSHWRQAEEYQIALEERSDFLDGWQMFIPKTLTDLWTQDNGMAWEIIGDGRKDGPIRGPALGLAALDAARCQRTGNPEFPVVYQDTDGTRYKLHHTRVAMAAQMPSPAAEMCGVGTCWLSRSISTCQALADDMRYKQEKMGSRPLRGIIYGSGARSEDVASAVQTASEAADNAGRARYSPFPVLTNPSGNNAVSLSVLDLASLPDGFDFQTDVTLGMFAIALAGGFPPRWLWPASVTGATKADAMYQHVAGSMSGFGHTLRIIQTIIGGSERGGRHSAGKFLPPHLRLVFDFQDDEQDRTQAEIRDLRSQRHDRDVAAGLVDKRTARQQMVADGDLTEAQFESLELTDGRTEEGLEVRDLFYTGLALLAGIDPSAPDLALAQGRLVEARRLAATGTGIQAKRDGRLAAAALEWLIEENEPEEHGPQLAEPAQDEAMPESGENEDGDDESEGVAEPEMVTLARHKSHVPERVVIACPLPGCGGLEADRYAGHKGLCVCVKCGATFDPSVEALGKARRQAKAASKKRREELEALDRQQARQAAVLRRELAPGLAAVLSNEDGLRRLDAISDEEWAAAVAADDELGEGA